MPTDVIVPGKQCMGTASFKLETDRWVVAFLSEVSQVLGVTCKGLRYCLEAKLFHPLFDSNKWEKFMSQMTIKATWNQRWHLPPSVCLFFFPFFEVFVIFYNMDNFYILITSFLYQSFLTQIWNKFFRYFTAVDMSLMVQLVFPR